MISFNNTTLYSLTYNKPRLNTILFADSIIEKVFCGNKELMISFNN